MPATDEGTASVLIEVGISNTGGGESASEQSEICPCQSLVRLPTVCCSNAHSYINA